jgi:tRNA-dihydrouridine synthase
VQICGSFPDHVARTAELIERECAIDFIDINMGCPIDLVCNKGSGACLLNKPQRLEQLVKVTSAVMEKPLTVKVLLFRSFKWKYPFNRCFAGRSESADDFQHVDDFGRAA